jgi:hypothetical protein
MVILSGTRDDRTTARKEWKVIRSVLQSRRPKHKAHTTALIEVRIGAKRKSSKSGGIACAEYPFA